MNTETFYTTGRRDCLVAVEVTVHDKGAVASAELDHITRIQLLTALQDQYPAYNWSARDNKYSGYWTASGRKA